jgi:transposase
MVSSTPSTPTRTEAEHIVYLTRELERAELKIRALEERLRLELIRKYGPKSEQINNAQLLLLDLEPGVSSQEVEAEAERAPLPPATPETAEKRKRGKHPGRQELPAGLPRVERIVSCTPEQCVCKACGKETVVIGYEKSEQLDVEPARYFVVVTRREKRACRGCAEGVSAAPLPARIIDKGLVSDRMVIDAIVSKYCDHLPLYRQSAMLERDTGMSISRATMDGWMMQTGESLIPVAAAIVREVLSEGYIQADEAPVPVQMPDKRGKHHQLIYGSTGDRAAASSLTSGWSRARRSGEIPRTFQRDPADRWLCCIRPCGRGRHGACRVLGACAPEGLRRAQTQSGGPRGGAPGSTHQ